MIRYVTVSEVATMHAREAGPDLLVDFGLLESAVLRPQTTVAGEDAYPDIHSRAAALFHSLARNHAFVDGNKRTAVLATAWFHSLNGWRFVGAQDDVVALAVDAAEGQVDVPGIAGRLKNLVVPIPLADNV